LCYAAIHGLRPSAEAYPAARVAALKALELDESNASAHDALADVMQGYDLDLTGAQVEFKRALQLNPSDLVVRVRYAESLTRIGGEDTIRNLKHAKRQRVWPGCGAAEIDLDRGWVLFPSGNRRLD
jgi:hypothetical protein